MLILILSATLAYIIYSLISSITYARYKKTNHIAFKDKYVHYRRKVHWIYDNFIFSYSLSLLYLTVFQVLVYMLSNLAGETKAHRIYVEVSFCLNLVIIFWIFGIYSAETLQGFKSYFTNLIKK